MKIKMRIDEGLMFSIPLGENMFGLGQLIAWQNPIFYMVAYNLRSPSIEIEEASEFRAILVGNFFDVLIRNGRWQPIRKSPIPIIPFPCFKVAVSGKFYIESWDRKRTREASQNDLGILEFRTDYGPMILENALKAHFGIIPPDKMFDPLKIENVANVSKMC